MRIVIDTSTQDTAPAIYTSPGSTSSSDRMAGGVAPATLQGSENTRPALDSNQPMSGGAPSAELLAAIAAVSPVIASARQMDGGPAPLN